MFYLQSISGQVYKVNRMPKYTAGYKMVGRKEYEEHCIKIYGKVIELEVNL